MARGLLASLAAIPVLLALSCGGNESTAPATPIATPRATPTTVATTQVATGTVVATTPAAPTEVATATAVTTSPGTSTPVPSPTATATPTPEPTPVPVTPTGPLLVFSERVGAEQDIDEREIEMRQIVVYDVGAERYWTPFEYRNVRVDSIGLSAVQPAGTSLLVWSEGQVRRMSLTGESEALLLEDDSISEIRVSPDGTKVAVMAGEPGTLLVLDAVSGEELLRVASDDPSLGSLRDGGRYGRLALGTWHAEGNAISVTAGDYSGPAAHTAILRLDGDVRVLPEGALVSLDLRYAIQLGEVIEWSHRTQHAPVWASLEIIEVATGRVIQTISDAGGITPPPADPGNWVGLEGPVRAGLLDRAGFSAFSVPHGGTWLLDRATGELQALRHYLSPSLGGRVRSTCWTNADPEPGSRACYVQYEARVVWEGAAGWTHYVGMIEPPDELAIRGDDMRSVAREAALPLPPTRDEMTGPLLAYEIHGEYEYYEYDVSGLEPRATRLVILYDEGTGRSWLAFTYRNWFAHGSAYGAARAVRGGLIASIDQNVVWVAPSGQVEVVQDWWPRSLQVSPDGRMAAAARYAGTGGPARTVVFDIPSGEEILRVVQDEIPTAAGLPPAMTTWTAWGLAWTSDSSAVVLKVVDDDTGYGGPTVAVIAGLDGALHLVPCEVSDYSSGSNCYAPDGRHVVRGRSEASGEYEMSDWYNWRYLDIIDSETEEVLWSVESSAFLGRWDWQWASPNYFAWSEDLLHRVYPDEFAPTASRADVSVLDIRTGEVELLDIDDYLARFHPPPRATTDCPENPGHSCQILLDGKTIGEGRWPRIVGFIELD